MSGADHDGSGPACDPDVPGAADAADAPGGAVVHDLGYARYDGTRRPQSTRYRTIARHLVRSSWRGFMRMKAWVLVAAITTVVLGTVMYVMEGISDLRRAGLPVPAGDAIVPGSFNYLSLSGFFLSLTVGASIIASDLRAGAFVFYFARPLRPIDYLAGKLLGSMAIMGTVFVLGPVALAFFRVGLAGGGDMAGALVLVPRAALVGLLVSLVFAVVPLGWSAVAQSPRYTVALWALFYLIAAPVAGRLAINLDLPALAALDIPVALEALALFFFDLEPGRGDVLPPAWAAGLALAIYVALALALAYWRVWSAERAGLGGSS